MNKSTLALLLIVLCFVGIVVILFRDFTPDDTFIHIAYAKDILEKQSYSFAGNKTYGSTAPLWPLLIATVSAILNNYILSAKALSLISAVGSIILLYVVLKKMVGTTKATLGALLLAANPYMLRWAATGMEATTAVLWTIFSIYVVSKNSKLSFLDCVVLGVGPLIRPELLIVVAVITLYSLRQRTLSLQKLIVLLTPLVVWNTFAFLYFGTILPNTFIAKAGAAYFDIESNIVLRTTKLFISLHLPELCLLLLSVCFLLFIIFLKKTTVVLPYSYLLYLIVAVLALFYSYYIIKNVKVLSRYALFSLPLVITAAIVLLPATEQFIKQRIIFSATILLSLVYSYIFTNTVTYPDAKNFVNGFQQEYPKIISLLKNDTNHTRSLAVWDIGMVGVYTGFRIYDFNGLVDKNRFYYTSNEEYLAATKPSFVITRRMLDFSSVAQQISNITLLYETTMPGLGINERDSLNVKVYKIEWK